MKVKVLGLLILCLLQTNSYSQVTNKIKSQLPSSFYSATHFKHDITHKKDIRNPQCKIIENLENPNGTIVLDGTAELKKSKELLDDPDKIIFADKYAEIPYKKNQTTYRIPINNISNHHSLDDPDIFLQLKTYISKCENNTGVIPDFVTIEHKYENFNDPGSCWLLSYQSPSNLLREPYYQARLNLACVLMKLFKNVSSDYAIK